ncbi:squalene/phytoene synthase family protein [Jatrophihabitans sp. DSM 45814]
MATRKIESTLTDLRQQGAHPGPVRENNGGVLDTLEMLAERAPAQATAENFPVALKVLPRRVRDQLSVAYAYARFVDDVGDEARGDRSVLLDAVAEDLDCLDRGLQGAADTAQLPVIRALAPLVTDAGIPIATFKALVEANRMDQRVENYETFADLMDYCALSAAPIGRMVLGIAHSATEQNIGDSDAVCAALQVLEHCQDVGEDSRSNRVYLPQVDLRANQVRAGDLMASETSEELRRVILQQVARSEHLLAVGRPLIGRLSGWPKLAVSAYLAGGLATAHALRRNKGEVLARPVRPSKARTGFGAMKLVASGVGNR